MFACLWQVERHASRQLLTESCRATVLLARCDSAHAEIRVAEGVGIGWHIHSANKARGSVAEGMQRQLAHFQNVRKENQKGLVRKAGLEPASLLGASS
jgi:hypothetical protein